MNSFLERWAPPLLFVLTFVVFLPTLWFEFVSWDDPLHVTQNPLVVEGHADLWWHWLRTPALGYPSPITVLTYRVEWLLVGAKPWRMYPPPSSSVLRR